MKKQKLAGWCLLTIILLCLSLLLILPAGAAPRQRLTVGGIPFGMRYLTDGVMVVGYSDVSSGGTNQNPAKEAGIRPGDLLISAGGKTLGSAAELANIIKGSNGEKLEIRLRREEREETASVQPLACDTDGKYRAGLMVRDCGAGMGTVTFVTENGSFAGLGHGVCDRESGMLIPMARGTVMDVTLGGVRRGVAGDPGELRGHFATGKIGAVVKNTSCGIYGMYSEKPSLPVGEYPVGHRFELREGDALLYCTLDNGVPQSYRIRISKINREEHGSKCFTVTVIDPALLEQTGGIVQGMSGSPIIQDGYLCGAITHVLVGDPTTGYGIFLDNMLENMPQSFY